MEQKLSPAEEQLTALIKQAGDEARMKKREIMAQHFNKIQNLIKEAISRKHRTLQK
jgi:F0F1-type ATP synthase membrane subunit b/b'